MSSNDKEEELTIFEIVKSIDQSLETSSNSNSHNSKDKKEEINIDNNDNIETKETSKTPSSSSSSLPSSEGEEKLKEKDEEEDGFRTPTRLDHKISALTCPPAPKKMKQSLKRRRASYNDQYYSNCRELLPLDLSNEVELLFQIKHIPFSDSHGAKKIRRDNQELK